MITRRHLLIGSATGAAAFAVRPAPSAPAASAAAVGPVSAAASRLPQTNLTNLAHLRFLLDEVPLPSLEGHESYRQQSNGLAPWTYASHRDDGSYERVGGGSLDAVTGYWSQGAYNSDDIARAIVVFVRSYAASGDLDDLATARSLLYTLTYLQVASGKNAGNVVLWMQADGTLTRSAVPKETPDPSDSDESYWLARTVWALGEAYPQFVDVDVEFAQFLADRLHLALSALERASLGRYGTWKIADGVLVPGWLIQGGADATAEAVLGLAAYAAVRQDTQVADAIAHYTEGIAAMSSGDSGEWPFGAILPWTASRTMWHAWGGLTGAALLACDAWATEDERQAALADCGVFTPQLLTSGGPYNSWTPRPGEAQIAYGAHGRVEGLVRAADVTGSTGFSALAGLAAAWFFGANPSGAATYDPATGVTVDGVETDGRVNQNSGAESTIHGLLVMQLLDSHPSIARIARTISGIEAWEGTAWIQAEDQDLPDGVTIATPSSAWTGEGNIMGSLVNVPAGGHMSFSTDVMADDLEAGAWGEVCVHPVLHQLPEATGTTSWTAVNAEGVRTFLGDICIGDVGEQGVTEWNGLLNPVPLPTRAPRDTVSIEMSTSATVEVDAIMLLAAVTAARYTQTTGGSLTLRASTAQTATQVPVEAGETGRCWLSDGRRSAPLNHGRSSQQSGAFSVTTVR